MHWDDLLTQLRRAGHEPEELDFMEDYGAIVREAHPELEGRHLRCIYGAVQLRRGIRFEAYLFPSAEEAEDFREMMGARASCFRVGNAVLLTKAKHLSELQEMLGASS